MMTVDEHPNQHFEGLMCGELKIHGNISSSSLGHTRHSFLIVGGISREHLGYLIDITMSVAFSQ